MATYITNLPQEVVFEDAINAQFGIDDLDGGVVLAAAGNKEKFDEASTFSFEDNITTINIEDGESRIISAESSIQISDAITTPNVTYHPIIRLATTSISDNDISDSHASVGRIESQEAYTATGTIGIDVVDSHASLGRIE